MVLYYREHEFGPKFPRMRVWTAEQGGYGQFDVMDYNDFDALRKLFAKYHWTLIDADRESAITN